MINVEFGVKWNSDGVRGLVSLVAFSVTLVVLYRSSVLN